MKGVVCGALGAIAFLCASGAAAQDAEIAQAKSAILDRLKDPDSARFDGLEFRHTTNMRGQPTEVVCGMVNARNSYGGMTGRRMFVYFPATGAAHIADGDNDLDRMIVGNFCLRR